MLEETDRIVAVVVTYNRKELLNECLEALNAQIGGISISIIVVDNNSSDGTREMVESTDNERIMYYNTGKNLGGAGGFNYGIKRALEHGFTRLWLMDDDTIPDQDALIGLVRAEQRIGGEYGFLSSFAYWVDGSSCKMNYQSFDIPRIWECIDLLCDRALIPVKKASFVSLYLPAEIIRKVGYPISEFYIWLDDVEYTSRISKRFPCYFVPCSRVLHKMGSNNQALIQTDSIDRMERYEYKYRNLYFIKRRDGRLWEYYYTMARDFYEIMRKGKCFRIKRVLTMIKGWKKGLLFRPIIEYDESEINQE